jgi:hypothetical protein
VRRAAAVFGCLAAVVACAAFAVHCDGESSSHPYSARQYVPDRDCVLNPIAIDVVSGPMPGDCTPACLVGSGTFQDGSINTWVSKMCPPLPRSFDTTGANPVCGKALAAFAREDYCTTDGGSTNPIPKDAGADAAAEAGPADSGPADSGAVDAADSGPLDASGD